MADETPPERPAPKPDSALIAGSATSTPQQPDQEVPEGGAKTAQQPVTTAPKVSEQPQQDESNIPSVEDDFTYSACLLTLYALGSRYEEIPSITDVDQPACGIERPLRVSEILPGLTLTGAPVVRCETARQLAFWSRDHLKPAAGFLRGSARLAAIEPGSTYQCRDVIGNDDSSNLSEHATGNAFDIMAFVFSDGSRLEIMPRQDAGDMAEAFQTAIRGAACLYFTTVLGPGSNAAHDNHLHFDLKPRKGGWRLCQ